MALSEEWERLERWLSPPRLGPYLTEMKGDKTAAIELYKWNLGISSASLELVLHAEVILRNAIDITICGKFGNNWMLDGEVLTDLEESPGASRASLLAPDREEEAPSSRTLRVDRPRRG